MTASQSTRPTRATAALLLAVAICLIAPASALATASYVFEPTLSLTGNCSKSGVDGVSDPGLCPIPPGVPGVDHPSKAFASPGVTADSYGDIYVASIVEAEGRIDVFGPDGIFITELEDNAGPRSIAVDSEGNLYVYEMLGAGERQVRLFSPSVYSPQTGNIAYGKAPVKIAGYDTGPFPFGKEKLQPLSSVAVDPATDELYVDYSQGVVRLAPAKEENKLLEAEAIKGVSRSTSIAIDSNHDKIYVSDQNPVTQESKVRVFELEAPHSELKEDEINGSTTPKGEFLTGEGVLALDVDENVGHVFVGDLKAANKVYEFEENGAYLATIDRGFEFVPAGEIAVDDGSNTPHPQKEAWLFIPSVPAPSTGHVFAFEPNEECATEIESTSLGNITETEATLHAVINPCGLETIYRLEFVSQQQFEAEEGKSFVEGNARIAGQGTLPKGGEGIAVSAMATELEPGVAYRFRVFGENGFKGKSEDEEEEAFKTFPPEEVQDCENEAFRTGLSTLLPDCRAYELVTPPSTNGRSLNGGGFGGSFPTVNASPAGNRASFLVSGGTIPGYEGSGAFNGELYFAARGADGWTTSIAGPSGEEASVPLPGSVSPDQTYSLWENGAAVYIRYPDGHSELVGRGSLGEDPKVGVGLVTEGASHIIFETKAFSAVELEPNAAPAGTATVYDRSAEGPTHVVSLLPGNEPQKAGEDAEYLGASEDGEGIAFEIGETIYLRLHNEETFEVAGSAAAFAGVADKGKRVFYVEGGDLYAFDTEEDKAIAFSSSGDVTMVNVASSGTRAYFVSPSALTTEPNPEEEEAEGAAENLYLSEEGDIRFVAKVTKRDVEGESTIIGQLDGLGLWLAALESNSPAKDSSRATPIGATFLFESRARLTGFESNGFAQVYRYDATEDRLDCLSCNPTGTPPTGDASLQSPGQIGGSQMKIANQSSDGKRAFFQTTERLVMRDTDGQLDVYEWEEGGIGSCLKQGGCVRLISGGHSANPDYLFAMSNDGDDAFFRTSDLLLPRDAESTVSIYDARVGGGFAEPDPEIPCQEAEVCRPTVTPPPALSTPGRAHSDEPGIRSRCPKGKHATKRHGRAVCVKNRRHEKRHHHRASRKKGGR